MISESLISDRFELPSVLKSPQPNDNFECRTSPVSSHSFTGLHIGGLPQRGLPGPDAKSLETNGESKKIKENQRKSMPRAMNSFRNPSEILKILPKSLKSFEILQDFLKISKISTISFKISPISTISFKISPAELKISRAIRHPTNIQGPQNSGSRGMEYGKKYFRWDA